MRTSVGSLHARRGEGRLGARWTPPREGLIEDNSSRPIKLNVDTFRDVRPCRRERGDRSSRSSSHRFDGASPRMHVGASDRHLGRDDVQFHFEQFDDLSTGSSEGDSFDPAGTAFFLLGLSDRNSRKRIYLERSFRCLFCLVGRGHCRDPGRLDLELRTERKVRLERHGDWESRRVSIDCALPATFFARLLLRAIRGPHLMLPPNDIFAIRSCDFLDLDESPPVGPAFLRHAGSRDTRALPVGPSRIGARLDATPQRANRSTETIGQQGNLLACQMT